MRIPRVLPAASAVAAMTTVTILATAPAASAETICREATLEDYSVAVVCAIADLNNSGATVAPYVWVGCAFANGSGYCTIDPVSLGRTGVAPSSILPTIYLDPTTLTVYSNGGSIGTVWVNGKPVSVSLPPFCVGDPTIC